MENTTNANATIEATSATKTANSYPFMTKAALKERLTTDTRFALSCCVIMQQRQTEYEQAKETTIVRNRQGWMSSHAVWGGRVARAVAAADDALEIDADLINRGCEMISHYSKQLAEHFRNEKLAADPALAAKTACFFTPQPTK